MNQGKLDKIKQEMVRVNIEILGISELKWMERGKFNSDDYYIYYCGQESLRRNGVALIVNKRVWNAVLGATSKMTKWSWLASKANHSASQYSKSTPKPLMPKKTGSMKTYRTSLMAQMVKNLPAMWETWVRPLGREDPLEKRMGIHSSILAWRILERGAWWATVHGVTKSQTQLGD